MEFFFKLIRGVLLREEKYTVLVAIRVIHAVIFFISRLIPLRATVEIYIFESK